MGFVNGVAARWCPVGSLTVKLWRPNYARRATYVTSRLAHHPPKSPRPSLNNLHIAKSKWIYFARMATATPLKRVLVETTNTARNIAASPHSAKKRKLETPSKGFRKPAGPNGPGSSQPKSQFETEVLEKLSQNLGGLKQKNQEKDQQWARPPLDDFNEQTDSLCFQQIEAEEGTLQGGKTTVKLFGVTEVRDVLCFNCIFADTLI